MAHWRLTSISHLPGVYSIAVTNSPSKHGIAISCENACCALIGWRSTQSAPQNECLTGFCHWLFSRTALVGFLINLGVLG